jgi:hypothetical protein
MLIGQSTPGVKMPESEFVSRMASEILEVLDIVEKEGPLSIAGITSARTRGLCQNSAHTINSGRPEYMISHCI